MTGSALSAKEPDRRPPPRYRRIAAFVAVTVVLGQVARLALLANTAPDLLRAQSSYEVTVREGFAASQTFTVRAGTLQAVRLDASVSGRGREARLLARLVERDEAGNVQPIAEGTFAAPDARDCCELRVSPPRDAAGKQYRLDLEAADFDGTWRFHLRARPTTREGGLLVNDVRQQANLIVDVDGATLAPLDGAPRIHLWSIMACFAVIDAAVTLLVYGLAVSSGRAPAS